MTLGFRFQAVRLGVEISCCSLCVPFLSWGTPRARYNASGANYSPVLFGGLLMMMMMVMIIIITLFITTILFVSL